MKFILFGIIGWSFEIVFTGMGSLVNGDVKLVSKTSLWMFPIYGMAAFLPVVSNFFMKAPVILRGGVYAVIIFLVEFLTGAFILKLTGECPWDYSESKYSYKGIIRFDYLPIWYITGLLFEVFNIQMDLLFWR